MPSDDKDIDIESLFEDSPEDDARDDLFASRDDHLTHDEEARQPRRRRRRDPEDDVDHGDPAELESPHYSDDMFAPHEDESRHDSENDDEDDDLPDFNALRLASERSPHREEDAEEIINRQSLINRQSSRKMDGPSRISMLNDPSEYDDTVKPVSGDESIMKKILLATACLVAASVSGVAAAIVINSPEPEQVVTQGPQKVDGGSIIDQSAQGAASGSQQSSSAPTTSEINVAIPEGGHKVVYRIKSEGDISAASTSYLDGSGSPKQETGVKIPWEKVVGAKSSVHPHFAVSSSGFGTLTCSITVDGKKVSEITSSGQSPTVQCD